MFAELGARAPFIRRVVLVTLFSVATSLAMTLLALRLVFHGHPGLTLSAAEVEWFSLSLSILAPALICPAACYRSAKLVAELEKARRDLDILAHTDQLTGLLNRRGFDAAAIEALEANRLARRPVAALICDIDHFKSINDRFGHGGGDRSLIRVAQILRAFSKSHGLIVGRQGGDEFVALAPGADAYEAAKIGEQIRSACAARGSDLDNPAGVSISIGAAVSARADFPLSALLRCADVALYDVKRSGRNRIQVAEIDKQWSHAA
jgi:diguanylate cyclase (GGDEF)-like protein